MKKSKKFFIRICLSTGILASATLLTACFGTPAKHVKANYKVTAEAIPDYQSKNAPISSYSVSYTHLIRLRVEFISNNGIQKLSVS